MKLYKTKNRFLIFKMKTSISLATYEGKKSKMDQPKNKTAVGTVHLVLVWKKDVNNIIE